MAHHGLQLAPRGARSVDGGPVGHVVEDVERLAMLGQLPLLEGDDAHVTGDTWISASTVMRLTTADAIDKYGAEDGVPGWVRQSAVDEATGDVWVATYGGVARLPGPGTPARHVCLPFATTQ